MERTGEVKGKEADNVFVGNALKTSADSTEIRKTEKK
jgi:hypothetical protein